MKLVISEDNLRYGILIYDDNTGIGCVSIITSGLHSFTTNMITQYKLRYISCNKSDLTPKELKQLLSNIDYLYNTNHICKEIKDNIYNTFYDF